MKIGLVGGSYQQRSLPFDAQRSINLYPVFDPQGKEVGALYGTPGLSLFGTTNGSPGRGCFPAANGRAFAVAGSNFFEVNSDGTTTNRGTLLTSTGNVSMEENGLQLAVCDGTYLYIFTYSTNSFAQVTNSNLPLCGTVTFIDGYFVVNKNSSGQFNISALYDGTTWSALDFATAESSPDNLLRPINAVGQLWLLGDKTVEIWTDTGATNFPFAKISGAKMEVGILAPHTAIPIDNTLFWLGKDNIGRGIVYRARGFAPQRISTEAIEVLIGQATSPANIRAYTYQKNGHVFYVLTGGGLPTTLVYDISTQLWHERAYLNTSGTFEQHLGIAGMFAFSKHLILSRIDGKIYEMSDDFYDDDGVAIASERIYTHLSNENIRQRFNQLEIAMETGIGTTTGTGNDPQITMWISCDGGRTYSNGYMTSFGKIGKYRQRAVFRRLGYAYEITFKVRITDPVKRVLIGSYLQ